ncbi:MAG: hypothetical protein LC723_04155 [Actinobacteria bacterium]|nr:hypothetical protein [Actinomycetota bacterium]
MTDEAHFVEQEYPDPTRASWEDLPAAVKWLVGLAWLSGILGIAGALFAFSHRPFVASMWFALGLAYCLGAVGMTRLKAYARNLVIILSILSLLLGFLLRSYLNLTAVIMLILLFVRSTTDAFGEEGGSTG